MNNEAGYSVTRARGQNCVWMVATGQEMVRKKMPQNVGKVREFHFESGKI